MNFICVQPIGTRNTKLINLNHVLTIIFGIGDDDRAIIKMTGGLEIEVKKSVIVNQIPFISLDK